MIRRECLPFVLRALKMSSMSCSLLQQQEMKEQAPDGL